MNDDANIAKCNLNLELWAVSDGARKLSTEVLFSETIQYSYLTLEMIRKLRIVRKYFLKGLANWVE